MRSIDTRSPLTKCWLGGAQAGGNKTISSLAALGCGRRVLLTGTPIQNQLDEFYAMLDFSCPGAPLNIATCERSALLGASRSGVCYKRALAW